MDENTLFPGRDNYTGPDSGALGLCHHNYLFEPSHSFAERVEAIRNTKPKNEIATRLHNLIYLDFAMIPGISQEAGARLEEAAARWQEADARWQEAAARLEEADARLEEAAARWQEAAARWREPTARWREAAARWREAVAPLEGAVLAYIRAQIPDCAWNGKQLVFPEA